METRPIQRFSSLRQSERGSTAVEFALILPILASLAFGAIDFGRMLWFKEVLVNATRVGARQGTLFASGNGQVEIEAAITASLAAGGWIHQGSRWRSMGSEAHRDSR